MYDFLLFSGFIGKANKRADLQTSELMFESPLLEKIKAVTLSRGYAECY